MSRFPGGESYKDLVRRLESIVVDLEQQVIPTLVVSHVSVLQLLIAYFRKSPVEECMHIEVPLHTVIKFTPARGGGWTESQFPLTPTIPRTNSTGSHLHSDGLDSIGGGFLSTPIAQKSPIWGDHMRTPSSISINSGTQLPSI